MAARSTGSGQNTTEVYEHKEQYALLRPDVGLQAQFKKKRPPAGYRYDPSLDPQLSWDINADRALAEQTIERIRTAETVEEARAAAETLKTLSSPFLNWAGKAERGEITLPTLPLFVHERLSTRAILDSVRTRKRQMELFADPQLEIADRALRAYEHRTGWVNRMILGDSLVVMNSLLQYEGLGGQVQMIYVDPPYGVKFGSNFQPFVRKRDVKNNADEDMTREPETVQAYRDTWELGLHSYLTYLRDRFLMARELLHPTGSIFVQISDENLHHVREVLDEVFGAENFMAVISFRKKTMPLGSKFLESVNDFILWYAKNKAQARYHQLFVDKNVEGDSHWNCVELPDGNRRKMTTAEIASHKLLPNGSQVYQLISLYPAGTNTSGLFPVQFRGRTYRPPTGKSWGTNEEGMKRLIAANRIEPYEDGETLRYVLKLRDYHIATITSLWADTSAPSDMLYAVQTDRTPLARCLLMTTDPGDLVLDPTCGSGTTAYVAEQWGRRWITIDTSRVPLALARQRLLTATFPYYELLNESGGVSKGFKYERRQNARGEEVGGIVPHVTLKSIAQNQKPEEEVLVDRPNVVSGVVRVSGPFVVEATIPTPVDMEEGEEATGRDGKEAGDGGGSAEGEGLAGHYSRMLEALRLSPVLHLPGNRTVTFKAVRRPARSLTLHAEAMVEGNGERPVAFVFGPESGPVTERLVWQALQEAGLKGYSHLYVLGFACQDAAASLIRGAEGISRLGATYVNATMDIAMGDLLKTSRASQLFSVAGAPDVRLVRLKRKGDDGQTLYQAQLLGLDLFDPVTMDTEHCPGDRVPAWFLDTDYNDLCFMVCQAFFPRTAAWDNLKRALKGVYDDSLWDHLAGTVSEPFVAPESKKIAVKVIDDRGNELLVVKRLDEAEAER